MGYSGIRIYFGMGKCFVCQTNEYSWYSDTLAVWYTKKSADIFSNFSSENRRLTEVTRSIFFFSSFFFSSLHTWSHCKFSFLDFSPFSFYESLFFLLQGTLLPWLVAGLFNTTVISSSFLSSSSVLYSFLVTRSECARNPPSQSSQSCCLSHTRKHLVQSLHPLFFPPHIGLNPGGRKKSPG